jgi:hypothetical protein
MVNRDRHTHPTKRSGRIPVTCAVCHRQYEARRRTARFCGTRCRKVAERRRGEPSKMDVTVNRRPSALAVGTRSPKSAERTSPRRCAASSAADVTLNHPVNIVPDAHWPNMWRLAYEDGRLSGMVNLTRARDALLGIQPSTGPHDLLAQRPMAGPAQRNVMQEIEETRRILRRGHR